MSPAPPRIVVFDIGGVLVRVSRSWRESQERAGLPGDPPPEDSDFEARRKQILAQFHLGKLDADKFAAEVAVASDGQYSASDILAAQSARLLGEHVGIAGVIDRIERAGIVMGLLSETHSLHWSRLVGDQGHAAEFPNVARAKHRYASHLLGRSKPDPAIYRALVAGTGYAGEQILFFDDTLENVDAARAEGWRAEWIDHTGDTAAQLLALLAAHGVPE